MKIAVIPARGGSKRIPKKNIKNFHGRPMIAWSIAAAIESNCFDRIIVSTDDDEIAKIAIEYGAEVPFMRPKMLSDDYTGTIPVIKHAIDEITKYGTAPIDVCCIYATAPFLSGVDLKSGLKVLLNDRNIDYVFSVTSYAFPIQRALRVTCDGRLEMLDPQQFETRSQDLEEVWHDAGQFYWGKVKAWSDQKTLFGPTSAPLFLPRHQVQDIDTFEDWIRAELMFKAMNS